MDSDCLFAIGVNTGNSLDAADVVLTKFGTDGTIVDLAALSEPLPKDLSDCLRTFRTILVASGGDMERAVSSYDKQSGSLPITAVSSLIESFTLFVSAAVKQLVSRVKNDGKIDCSI